ncbi:glycosyltransferase family 9 protein [Streptomyces litchfieldiae]|uniref:Glycosyltransferase family 9 protein n=1 Tax=Streptomyces litchfieldiae TaxID=3075543 RepID=A0ABU2MXK4_9ACTN|nr:glycosyltransferase family 9 protein [Streptomyces sp. DSM 44938]MDT0346354.1 glycosyltransferase family 9 protein [Streptomyces sp. DSM 44938]
MTIVALRALGLGDLLTAVPALRALRRAHPGQPLLLAAPPWLTEAAAATGAVDRLVPADAPGRAVPASIPWAGPRPDLAVDLHGSGPESLRPLGALRPGRLFGYAHPSGPAWDANEHERDRWCRLLTSYGIPADPADLRIPPPATPSPAPGAVVLHPGADAGARRWPADRFAALGRALARDGHRVVVTGGPAEAPLVHRVTELAGLPPTAALIALPFPALAALTAAARAVVVGDTGIAHLATALATPSITLFGPVSPRLWGPPDSARHRVLWHPGLPHTGTPHGRVPDERLLAIGTAEALSAVRSLPEGPA